MKHQNYDKRIFRFLYILNRLDSGQSIFTPNLAKEFNVSLRTIQRDIELLNLTGFPLAPQEKGRYAFVDGFSLKKSMVSNEEASLLSLMFDIAKSLGSQFEESFRGILRKVLSQKGDAPVYVKMPKGIKLDKETPYRVELEEAIVSLLKIRLIYESQQGQKKEFIIWPLKIIFFDGFWYLLSITDKNKRLIKLRIDKIRRVETLSETYRPLKNLKTLLDESVNVWFPEKRDQKVRLQIDKSVASYFRQKSYFPLQRIVKDNKDGSVILEAKVSEQFMEVIPTVLQWMPLIKPLAPKELIAVISERLSQYQRLLK